MTIEPPPTTVQDVLAFMAESVGDGSLYGDGQGKSASGRLKALKNMIEASGDLIEAGYIAEACDQLQDAYNRTDGYFPPPDFAAGPAAVELADMILQLMTYLGCE